MKALDLNTGDILHDTLHDDALRNTLDTALSHLSPTEILFLKSSAPTMKLLQRFEKKGSCCVSAVYNASRCSNTRTGRKYV